VKDKFVDWLHYEPDARCEFRVLKTSEGSLTLTDAHMVYVQKMG